MDEHADIGRTGVCDGSDYSDGLYKEGSAGEKAGVRGIRSIKETRDISICTQQTTITNQKDSNNPFPLTTTLFQTVKIENKTAYSL